jgi:arabinogalactan endo-1,4-beta-galactosidase
MKNAGAEPDMIQTGNEISYGMLWGTEAAVGNNNINRCYSKTEDANWSRFVNLLKKAGQACREECQDAKIILHTERTSDPTFTVAFYNIMKNNNVDYDIIGLSYYPEHHGNLQTLETALSTIESQEYGKDIMVVETGYSYAWHIGNEFDYSSTYPLTEEGQRQFTADLITKLNSHSSVKGLFWWWPEDNGNKQVTNSWWNAALYDHSTGKPYAAFYELKNFVSGSSSIATMKHESQNNQTWYSLDGRKLNGTPQTKGIYINNNQKIIVR